MLFENETLTFEILCWMLLQNETQTLEVFCCMLLQNETLTLEVFCRMLWQNKTLTLKVLCCMLLQIETLTLEVFCWTLLQNKTLTLEVLCCMFLQNEICCTLQATIPGITCGPLTAELVTQSHGRWMPVFVIAAGVNFVGAIIYLSQSSASQVLWPAPIHFPIPQLAPPLWRHATNQGRELKVWLQSSKYFDVNLCSYL